MDNHTDEPLDRWAQRRQRRLRPVGERRAVPLAPGPQRAAHVNPNAPRVLLEWDGMPGPLLEWPTTMRPNASSSMHWPPPIPCRLH
ncbi:hypothetical protein P3T39_007338 [Kitasatospora sp. GP82]|nr:hypothetical protein [Kitasatospora sp. GP82]